MEEDIQNHSPTVMFRGTPCTCRAIVLASNFKELCNILIPDKFVRQSVNMYIYFACLSVCPFESDQAQILCGTSYDPRENLWNIKIEIKFLEYSWIFLENAPI